MLQACHVSSCKAAANFEAFRCGQTHHGFGKIGFQLVKDGFTETGWHTTHHTLDDTTNTVSLAAHLFNECNHGLNSLWITGSNDVGFNSFCGEISTGGHHGLDVLDGLDVSKAFVAI